MAYSRVTPRARSGTTGINEETDLTTGNGVWIAPPDRVAAVTISVHIPSGQTGKFTIETTCNRLETIGVYGDGVQISENTTVMIANAVTGIRVNCIAASQKINVAFCG